MKLKFAIRTITAGVDIKSLHDMEKLHHAIRFLKNARKQFQDVGYDVQTIRIATPHFYLLSSGLTDSEVRTRLAEIDKLTHDDHIFLSIGELCKPEVYDKKYVELAEDIIAQTRNINFSVRISEFGQGIYYKSIRQAAEIISAIAYSSLGGEGNFRFAAAANCQPHIPFFPVAYHEGAPGFTIGIESPNILLNGLVSDDWEENKLSLEKALNDALIPIQMICEKISDETGLEFFGIDTSTAPGLNASIGGVVEKLTGHPFGHSSTLAACSLITDVIKNLDVKTCGYSGLMLPVLEDKVLAMRAKENNFTINELLMYSAVSGTGLDVVPIPGYTTVDQLQRILLDVASLSVKYVSKAMSARLFLIPGKKAGDDVSFENTYLTDCKVMEVK